MPLRLVLSATLALLVSGCYFQMGGARDFQPLDKVTIPTGFDFATNNSVRFKLDVKAVDYDDDSVPFLLPYVGPVHVVLPGASADEILGTGMTDATGYADFRVRIPSSAGLIVLRPEQNSLEQDSTPSRSLLADFDQLVHTETKLVERTLTSPYVPPLPSPSARGGMDGGVAVARAAPIPFITTSAGYRALSAWNAATGVPAGLITPRPWFSFKMSFKKNVGFTFPEGKRIPDAYLNTGDLTNIILDASAEVSVSMASESTQAKNAIGYFVRKKTTIPRNPSDLPPPSDIVIIFPNASLVDSGGGLYQGDTIRLRNPDPASANYQTTIFDAGMVISWVLIPGAFSTGEVTAPSGLYYSLPVLNPESGSDLQKAHVAQLLYNKPPYNLGKSFYLVAFEDQPRSLAEDGDFNDDFNDVMITANVTPSSAMSSAGLPEVADETATGDTDKDGVIDAFDEYPSDPARSSSLYWPSRTGYATVMYEDRWPALGDYDFNDLVVDIRLRTVANAAGMAVDLAGEFRVRAAGGELKSGLAFSLPFAASAIRSVDYSRKQVDTSLFSPGANGVESSGTGSSVVPVFSDAHGLFGVSGTEFINTDPVLPVRDPQYLTVTVRFDPASQIRATDVSGSAPDFFLTGSLTLNGRVDMRKEIHTIGNLPSALADSYPFGELDDRSPKPPAAGLYYKDARGAPWALLLPRSTKYPVEKSQLASSYRYFSQWVYSGGTEYPDWYNSDKTDYVDTTKLFMTER